MKPNYTTTAVVALVIGVSAFLGGMQFQKSQPPARGQLAQFASRNALPSDTQARNGFNGGRIVGEIINADSNGITIKLQDGSSKIILLSDKTAINKSTAGTKDDLKSGTTVAAFGSTNPDGSVSAITVELNPQLPTMGEGTSRPTQR